MLNEHMVQLDADQPNWYIDWATGEELRQFALASAVAMRNNLGVGTALLNLRTSVGVRVLHRVINSALSADIVAII